MKNYITIIILIFSANLYGQVPNDECLFATHLGSIIDYCSEPAEFSNVDATPSSEPIPFCWFGGSANDIWFTFKPTAPGVFIQMLGASLNTPSIVVYDGTCSTLNEVSCGSKNDDNIVELSITDLIIGKTYYLRVDAENERVGTFQLCLKSFFPVPMPESDCPDAVVLCDKSPFQIDNLNSTGNIQNELTGPCVDFSEGQDAEEASVWYVWQCKDPGSLTFVLEPNNPNSNEEDLDFVVYELPGGIDDCDNRIALRCMLSGRTQGLTPTQNLPCVGPTGLAEGETDISETAGCNDGSNNFVAPLDMEAGKFYGLIINNYSESGYGFSIDFGGTGTFQGPEPEFSINAEQAFPCDKSVNFIDSTATGVDPIVNYFWTFGDGSSPETASGPGPHSTIYNSFGDKVAALTVESSRGCLVTEIVEFYVEPCCKDTSNLNVTALGEDVECFGDEDGLIQAQGMAGDPEYQYSLDGDNYQPNPQFSNLPAGNYQVYIQDIKGCESVTNVQINQPTQTLVDAGIDTIVELGQSVELDANVDSDFFIDSIFWTPLDSFLNCTECYDPEVIPPGETVYTITVVDENGCTATDEVRVRVNIVRPVFWPNVFSPNEDNNNDFFNLFGGPAVKKIRSLKVFDRWGNKVYVGSPTLNDYNDGWDGLFNNQYVSNGVYGWIAEVLFVDNVTLTFAGDITVMR